MIEQLFGSKTRVKLLQLFYGNPNRSFYVREITRKIDEQINSVRRELSNLLSIGIIVSDSNNNKLYYEVNQKFKFYPQLKEIFGDSTQPKNVKKVVEGDPVDNSGDLKSIGHVELAILTGQFTRDNSVTVDLLIVGEVNPNSLQKYVDNLEIKENKTIRYSAMKMSDFKYRKDVRDRFITSVLNSKKQVLIDEHNILNEN
ncbi:MAG: transcriptional regulator [bacterium]|jgi:predicted transcriptional regulator with HTH domain